MKKVFLTVALMLGVVCMSTAQERKPAMAKKSAKKSKVQAQGYIKNQPSNRSQDKQLKEINDSEAKAYAPKTRTKPKATNTQRPKGKADERR
ncbi:hypothetical protein [Pontimicrobium sp. MEBiC06410]